MNDLYFMEQALLEARMALKEGEMPVGAVVAKGDKIIARAHNLREKMKDPTAHAEILALRRASEHLGGWRLEGCTLYVTLEPCPMCAGAIVQSRIEKLVYGAADQQAGCAGSIYRITEDPAFNHYTPSFGGIMEKECREILEDFFSEKRA